MTVALKEQEVRAQRRPSQPPPHPRAEGAHGRRLYVCLPR
jgi:hypothetical protein